MEYSISFEPVALRQLKKIDNNMQTRLKTKILALSDIPRPHGVKKLRGYENTYRIRVGNYRIIYDIQDKQLLILIISVGHRSDVY